MSVALLGVIIIQFLWIKNAMQMKQEQFERSVNSALVRVSADLENKYGVHWITEKLESDSSALKEVMSQDPGFYRFMVSTDESGQCDADTEDGMPSGHKHMVTTTAYGTINIDTAITSDNCCTQNKVVTLLNVNRGKRPLIIENGVWEEPPAVSTPHNPVPPPKGSRLVSIVKSAADEWAMSKMNVKDVSEALDSGKIRTAIAKEFKRQGLPDNFVFATYCTSGDTLMINKKASVNPLQDFAFHAPLMATDFIDEGSLLLINFPYHYKYLFSSIAGMLALSLLFTISIMAAFGYSLHVIFKQKKISDITNDFINNMTHELKTPLATISMTADTLALATVNHNNEMVSEYSGMIKNEVKKLSVHVDRILEAALLEKNGSGIQNELIHIDQLVEDEVKIFTPRVEQLHGNIKAELPGLPVKLHANKDLLRSAISNLPDNAIKYSKNAPEIVIKLQVISGKILLRVSDKGIGISRADQVLVFEKFYRAYTGNRHDVKGFGLGLSFVKDVVGNLNGRVWVESELGKGSSFFIEIPLT
jgi:two-component system, OmpR family, phosphate regulon sensor histidine kinase PhoR